MNDVLKSIKSVIVGVEGTIFAPAVIEGLVDGEENAMPLKIRCHADGQGISLLRAIGISVCIITGEKGLSARPVEQLVTKWNALPSTAKIIGGEGWPAVALYTGAKKLEAAEAFLKERSLSWGEIAVMGCDLGDVPLMKLAATAAAPAQAEDVVKNLCQFVAQRRGGEGAIRDLANAILEVRGIDPLTLPLK